MISIQAPWDKLYKLILFIGIIGFGWSFLTADEIRKENSHTIRNIDGLNAELEIIQIVDSVYSREFVDLKMLELSLRNLMIAHRNYNYGLEEKFKENEEELNREEKEDMKELIQKMSKIERKRDSLYSITTKLISDIGSETTKFRKDAWTYLYYIFFSLMFVGFGGFKWYQEDMQQKD